MKKLIKRKTVESLLVFLLLTFSFELNAQPLTSQQIIEDLELLEKELPKQHVNLFAKISEEDFHAKIVEIKQKSASLNDASFEIELYKLFKEIGDEHTKIDPSYKKNISIYPLSFDFF